jgi:hypothetical protein
LNQYYGTVKNVQLNNENGHDVYKISIQDQNGKNHCQNELRKQKGPTLTFFLYRRNFIRPRKEKWLVGPISASAATQTCPLLV